ncbi:MAG: sialidase family protein, partial [Gemmatimonadota bacterium]
MKLVSCQVFRTHDRGRPVVNGFVSYVHPSEPHLMLCTGYEDYSDAYDEYAASLSRDHGVTWSGPEMVYAGREVEGGRLRYAEPAAFYDAERDRLVVLADENFYPRDTLDVDGVCRVVARTRDGATGSWSAIEPLDLTPGRSLAVSFSFALAGADGRVLVPAMRPLLDGDGKPVHYRGCWATADEPLVLIGERAAGEGAPGSATAAGWRWHLSDPVPVDLERTSRGLNENTLAELADGRLAMVCRG